MDTSISSRSRAIPQTHAATSSPADAVACSPPCSCVNLHISRVHAPPPDGYSDAPPPQDAPAPQVVGCQLLRRPSGVSLLAYVGRDLHEGALNSRLSLRVDGTEATDQEHLRPVLAAAAGHIVVFEAPQSVAAMQEGMLLGLGLGRASAVQTHLVGAATSAAQAAVAAADMPLFGAGTSPPAAGQDIDMQLTEIAAPMQELTQCLLYALRVMCGEAPQVFRLSDARSKLQQLSMQTRLRWRELNRLTALTLQQGRRRYALDRAHLRLRGCCREFDAHYSALSREAVQHLAAPQVEALYAQIRHLGDDTRALAETFSALI